MPLTDPQSLAAMLPSSELLHAMGVTRLLSADFETGVVRVEVMARPEFCHTNGTTVQGGFITAWMDFSMAMATHLKMGDQVRVASLEIKVNFLERVGPGRAIAEGRILRLGRRVAFLESTLFDEAGKILATASSSAMLIAPK